MVIRINTVEQRLIFWAFNVGTNLDDPLPGSASSPFWGGVSPGTGEDQAAICPSASHRDVLSYRVGFS